MKYILAADDELTNRLIIEEILDDFEVQSVVDGLECLKSIEKKIPDLLLLDVSMPGADGIEVCRKLRSDKKTENLPIIMLSGFAAKENVEKGFAAGASDYLTKPFDPTALRNAISKLLAG